MKMNPKVLAARWKSKSSSEGSVKEYCALMKEAPIFLCMVTQLIAHVFLFLFFMQACP
eukprot:JP448207.1.p3 GENE.JP448207.1~~JP448207.1.p3  ORF type:complete len:58 (+),score=9.90 JP448207.1:214-387(+)